MANPGKSRQIQANLDKFRQINQQAGCYSRVQAETGGKFEKKIPKILIFCLYMYVSISIRLYPSVFVYIRLYLPGFA